MSHWHDHICLCLYKWGYLASVLHGKASPPQLKWQEENTKVGEGEGEREMAEAIVGPLLSKLQEVAVKEGKALAGVGDEISRLRERLMWLHALVHETDLRSRSEGNHLVRVLACQMREIAFEAEDAIDRFVLEVDLSRVSHHWRQATWLFLANFATQIRVRYILSRKIKSMSARLEDIHDNSAKYTSNNESTTAIKWRASRYIPPVRHNW